MLSTNRGDKKMNEMKTNASRPFKWSAICAGFCLLAYSSFAAPQPSSLNIVPSVTNISFVNGQLLASGLATATVHGRNFTAPFANVPVNIALAPGTNAPGTCPVLNLTLGPIDLDLLGLVVQTSPICLDITATSGGGLLGDLLCSLGNLLNQGLNLQQALGLLTVNQLNQLLTGLTGLLNGVLGNLLQAVLQSVQNGAAPGECAILNLALGPLDLNLLGLGVHLDNCGNGPVTVTITAHHGALLGNLLCSLTNQGALSLGSLLSDILGTLGRTGPL
jgi:hypothetical protein